MRKKLVALSTLLVLPLFLSACADRPSEQIEAAEQAAAKARSGDVKDYAPESLEKVEMAYAGMQAEVEEQDGKFAVSRSYDRSVELANEVQQAADQAISDAAAAKEKMEEQSAQTIQTALTTLNEARTMLSQAPKGKGSQADIDAMKVDLSNAEKAIEEAQAAHDTGSFMEAQAKADSAIMAATQVKDAVTMARELRAGSR